MSTDREGLQRRVARRLAVAGVPTADVDARWLVGAVLERFGPDPAACDLAVLDGMVERRAARVPLQLVLGRTAFRWVEVACRPGVFVPRPETEVVAGVAIEAARSAGPRPRVVEPCTGTGAITCALLSEVPGAEVLASDASEDAVELARENVAAVLEATAPTPWQLGAWGAPRSTATVEVRDVLDAAPAGWHGTVDVLVCNPPYLPAADTPTWAPEVAEHDPHAALVGGPDGHEVVDALLAAGARWLRPGGTVVVEIDDRRGGDALEAAARASLVEARLVTDLTGRDRAVVATTPTGGAGRE